MNHDKEVSIKDPLHGYMEMDNDIIKIINTPPFQRLRGLRQLGFCSYVYPTAEHSRFSHSIGTCYLAGKAMKSLQKKQPELNITDRDIFLVMVAGLCHDAGHGPNSHAFETWLHKMGINFRHELMSVELLKVIVEDYDIQISSVEIDMINHMILGKVYDANRSFMYSIVNDANASIDVDKMDYLYRDGYFTGKNNKSYYELLNNCRVIDGKLCYDEKEDHTIYELFYTRYSMHKQVYLHKTVKAVELMFLDVMNHISKCIDISEYINDPRKYITLTDNFIRYLPTIGLMSDPTNVHFLAAKKLLNDIHCRKIYKAIIVQPWEFHNNQKEILTEDKILEELVTRTEQTISVEDIRVEILTLNYAMQDKNPVDNVLFYNKLNRNKYFTKKGGYRSALLPKVFIEHFVRIFMVNPDDEIKKTLIIDTFNEFALQHGQVVGGMSGSVENISTGDNTLVASSCRNNQSLCTNSSIVID